MCHRTVEVRQFVSPLSSLHCVGSKDWTQITSLGSKVFLTRWAIFLAPGFGGELGQSIKW